MDLNGEKATENSTETEPSLTMVEVLELEKEMEDEYAAVLGGSDENKCTYADGHVKRQALYSCLTCNPESRHDIEKCAGICLACSYQCHENHELIELYTKRNFRCDCPTARFQKNVCVLNTNIEKPQPKNEGNKYNQNFQSTYCNCKRPYPDPDRTTEEVMIQCVVCEDWYHLHHLGVPANNAQLANTCSEMICGNCMTHQFLRDYSVYALKLIGKEKMDAKPVDINVDDAKPKDAENSLKEIEEPKEIDKLEDKDDEPEIKRKKFAEEEKKPKNNCRRPRVFKSYEKGATFWPNDWRSLLCKCDDCLQMYRAEKVEFLIDIDDSPTTYEERGMKRAAAEVSTYERGIRALATMEHSQQIDAILEYNFMKDKLKDFLRTFVENKQVVTEADIKTFFEGMRTERVSSLRDEQFLGR